MAVQISYISEKEKLIRAGFFIAIAILLSIIAVTAMTCDDSDGVNVCDIAADDDSGLGSVDPSGSIEVGERVVVNGVIYEVASYVPDPFWSWDKYLIVVGAEEGIEDLYIPGGSISVTIWKAPTYSVEYIADGAFAGRTDIKTLSIWSHDSDGISRIGKSAFKGCTNLRSVTIDNNTVRTIGESAFEDCTALTEFRFDTISGEKEKTYDLTIKNYALMNS